MLTIATACLVLKNNINILFYYNSAIFGADNGDQRTAIVLYVREVLFGFIFLASETYNFTGAIEARSDVVHLIYFKAFHFGDQH